MQSPVPGDLAEKIRNLFFQQSSLDLPDVVYHYTSGAGLMGIIESNTIHATQISCLNDPSEYRYSSELLHQAFKRRRLLAGSEPELDPLYSTLQANMDRESFQYAVGQYVACFCSEDNILSQWKTYAQGEDGYAIGFRFKESTMPDGCALHRIVYADFDSELPNRVCQSIVDDYKQYAADERRSSGATPDVQRYLLDLGQEIASLSALIKHPSYEHEKEIRLLYTSKHNVLPEADRKQLRFFQKRGLLARRLPLPLKVQGCGPAYSLPIVSVRVGPSRFQRASEQSVIELLRANGRPNVDVTCSDIPYREL